MHIHAVLSEAIGRRETDLQLGDLVYQERFVVLDEEYRGLAERHRKMYVRGIVTGEEYASEMLGLYCEQQEAKLYE